MEVERKQRCYKSTLENKVVLRLLSLLIACSGIFVFILFIEKESMVFLAISCLALMGEILGWHDSG